MNLLYGAQAGVGLSAIDDTLSRNDGALGLAPLASPTQLDLVGTQGVGGLTGPAPLVVHARLYLCGAQIADDLAASRRWQDSRSCNSAVRSLWTTPRASHP